MPRLCYFKDSNFSLHLDGFNAEHKFLVWVTILGHTSHHCHFDSHLIILPLIF